jgi:4-hydroxy-3-methylbut-2-enyl diphosphate reductase
MLQKTNTINTKSDTCGFSRWTGTGYHPIKLISVMINISIEEKSGFCYGVVRVVELADRILDNGEILYSLGQIVHNEMEVQRLEQKGLKIISRKELTNLHDCKMLIRAHGEPPSTYEISKNNNIELIDGTCPIVRKIQLAIAARAEENGVLIVIFGKKDHPEVEGLFAQAPSRTIVIQSVEEVPKLPVSANLHFYSQTTMDSEFFRAIVSQLERKQKNEGGKLEVHNTICGHVSHRRPGLQKFASENDIIIFVGGKHSSNGKVLFQVCKDVNSNSYYVGHPDELMRPWFDGARQIGVAGATSTPHWQIEQVAEKIRMLTNSGL